MIKKIKPKKNSLLKQKPKKNPKIYTLVFFLTYSTLLNSITNKNKQKTMMITLKTKFFT